MNTNHNKTRPSDSLFRLQEALVALVRTRLNVGLGTLGLVASLTLSKIVWWTIFLIILLNVFLFGNIALGFYLGYLLDGVFYGFGVLTLFYLALLLIAILTRGLLQARVRNATARAATQSLDKMNAQLDGVAALRVVPEYREAVLRSAAKPVEGLERRVMESSRRAAQAQAEVMRQVDYLRLNYKRVAADMAEQQLAEKVPAYRFVSGFVARFLGFGKERKPLAPAPKKSSLLRTLGSRLLPSLLERSAAFLPYMPLVLNVLRPVLAAAAISKSRNILAKLFGIKRRF